MNESEFHSRADRLLTALAEQLEAQDKNAALEIEQEQASLSILLPGQRTLLLSKHAPSRQLWLSSPISGGLHFSAEGPRWIESGGRELLATLTEELVTLAGVVFTFPDS